MTDKLHCPFCGAELFRTGVDLTCMDYKCKGWEVYLPSEIWQALIDGKKAQDALKVATDFIGFVNTSRHADGALAAIAIGKIVGVFEDRQQCVDMWRSLGLTCFQVANGNY